MSAARVAEMVLTALSDIPGFVDHGDGTWSITRRRRPRTSPRPQRRTKRKGKR